MSYQNLSLGKQMVRCNAMQSGVPAEEFKLQIANLIDYIDSNKHEDPRLAAITISKLEEACEKGVKLLTTQIYKDTLTNKEIPFHENPEEGA